MCVHEQDLHPAHFVQHLDDVRLYSLEGVHRAAIVNEAQQRSTSLDDVQFALLLRAFK